MCRATQGGPHKLRKTICVVCRPAHGEQNRCLEPTLCRPAQASQNGAGWNRTYALCRPAFSLCVTLVCCVRHPGVQSLCRPAFSLCVALRLASVSPWLQPLCHPANAVKNSAALPLSSASPCKFRKNCVALHSVSLSPCKCRTERRRPAFTLCVALQMLQRTATTCL